MAAQYILAAMTQSLSSLKEVVAKRSSQFSKKDATTFGPTLPNYGKALPYYGQALPSVTTLVTNKDQDDEIAEFGRVPNPTLHIVLNQLRRLINRIVLKFGRPAEVYLEISQDLRWTETRKKLLLRQKRKGLARFLFSSLDLERSASRTQERTGCFCGFGMSKGIKPVLHFVHILGVGSAFRWFLMNPA